MATVHDIIKEINLCRTTPVSQDPSISLKKKTHKIPKLLLLQFSFFYREMWVIVYEWSVGR